MAVGNGNLDPNPKRVSNSSLNPMSQGGARYRSEQQSGPYRGGLQSDFNFGTRSLASQGVSHGSVPSSFGAVPIKYSDPDAWGYSNAATHDADADVRGAAAAAFELQNPNSGTSSAEQQALLNMYKGRIATKNTLAEQIANSERGLRQQEDLLTGAAGESLGEGLKGARENYNSRGLLYSGLRQGGEQKVKQGVASSLDSGISGARRESANAKSSAQNAYASVGLQNAQESLQMAHEAFDTASRNNIARLQAMQQLGSAAGSAVGTIAGSRQRQPGQAAQPSGPSNYDTSATNNYYDGRGGNMSGVA